MIRNVTKPKPESGGEDFYRELGRRFLDLLPTFSERLAGDYWRASTDPRTVPFILALKDEVDKAKNVATEDTWEPSFIAVYIALAEGIRAAGGAGMPTQFMYAGSSRRRARRPRGGRAGRTMKRYQKGRLVTQRKPLAER
jgi:hypothetical protein